MDDQESTSHIEEESSEESQDSEMETDSDESVSGNESKPLSEPFVLPVTKMNTKSRTQTFESYLNKKNSDKQDLMMKATSESVRADFNPWWDSYGIKKSAQSQSSKQSLSADGSYDSWFDKSNANEQTDNWLCGPKPQSSSTDDAPQIQDIEVPSIYDTASYKPKSRRATKKERKVEREKTTGKKWFDMKLADVDNNTKMDMEIIRMRQALDPKKFFKQNDRSGLPKYFQLGTVVDEGTDFYSSRLTKKQRKQTLVEELMADTKIRQYNKRKYEEVQQKKRSKKFTKKKKA